MKQYVIAFLIALAGTTFAFAQATNECAIIQTNNLGRVYSVTIALRTNCWPGEIAYSALPTNDQRYWEWSGSNWVSMSLQDQQDVDAAIQQDILDDLTNRNDDVAALIDALIDAVAAMTGSNRSDVVSSVKTNIDVGRTPVGEQRYLKK